MKLDKETLIIIFVSMVILIGWEPFAVKMGWLPDPKATSTVVVDNTKTVAPATAIVSETPVAEVTQTQVEEDLAVKVDLPKDIQLENDNVIVKFNDTYSAIDSITFKQFWNNDKTDKIVVKNEGGSQYGMLELFFNNSNVKTITTVALNDVSKNSITVKKLVTFKDGKKITVSQNFTLLSDYRVQSSVSFLNSNNSENVKIQPSIWAGDLQSWSKLSGDEIRAAKFSYGYYSINGEYETLDADDKEKEFAAAEVEPLKWAAITNKFFALVFEADKGSFKAPVTRKLVSKKEYLLAFQADFNELNLAPKAQVDYDVTFYVGPKEVKLLQAVSPECDKLVKLSWGPLNPLAKAMLWCLIQLHAICGSYGWSIIILTVIVRLIFWPVTQKANDSMKKMQNLKPQIDKLREQYKNNPQMLNTKTMELYKKEGVNPMGGCLPILFQIPVFFALYATLDGAFALRQVPFLWAHNLAAPDTVLSFPLGFTLFGISNFDLNPLVIAMTILMVLQQKLTPTSMDPMQQKMMALMPVFMLIFLYELPSGLTLYWTVSQIFSILQLFLQKKRRAAQEAK